MRMIARATPERLSPALMPEAQIILLFFLLYIFSHLRDTDLLF
jgi:hypothetical protein